MLAEKPLGCNAFGIQDVHEGDGILGQTGREDDHLVVPSHLGEKLIASGPYFDINVVDLSLDVYRQSDVWVVHFLELRVHQSLVNIEQQSLPSAQGFRLRLEESLLARHSKGDRVVLRWPLPWIRAELIFLLQSGVIPFLDLCH